jgi:two-component system, OmpR family, sensor histidine kinase AdeS
VKLPTGLSRQIVQSMMGVVLGAVLLVIIGSYVFYTLFLEYWPTTISSVDDITPSAPECAWMVLTTLAALSLATSVAVKLSRRILMPLTSVAESLRKIASGELSARAVSADQSLGEAALLVDDFNMMAERLQRMAQEQVFWNAAIAHELRTPVTILRGRLQGLAEGVFEPSPTQFASLLTQVEGLTRLIEDLRILSLAESQHLRLQLVDTDLSADILAVLQLYDTNLTAAGLEVETEIETISIRCDPVRIRQALLALLENARRYATPGMLRIQARVVDEQYVLSVEDSGPGISTEMASRVFDPFQRGEHAHSRENGSSGLGLAVVRAIAQAHGGHACCSQGSQGGSVFSLSLPIDQV